MTLLCSHYLPSPCPFFTGFSMPSLTLKKYLFLNFCFLISGDLLICVHIPLLHLCVKVNPHPPSFFLYCPFVTMLHLFSLLYNRWVRRYYKASISILDSWCLQVHPAFSKFNILTRPYTRAPSRGWVGRSSIAKDRSHFESY